MEGVLALRLAVPHTGCLCPLHGDHHGSTYLTITKLSITLTLAPQICWGPLSFVTAGLITTDHPLRHALTIIISLGQLYGDVLYYATCMFDHYLLNRTYTRPEAAYFWGYFVFMNSFWIVIPLFLLCSSVGATWRAFDALDKADKILKGKGGAVNGSAKKKL